MIKTSTMFRTAPKVDELRAALPHPESTISRVHGTPDRLNLDKIYNFFIE